MRTSRAAAFKRELAGLSREALAGFVADLWSGRGFEILEEGGSEIVIECGSSDVRTLLISPRPNRIVLAWLVDRNRLNRIDVVVTSRESELLERIAVRTDTELIGPEILYQFATYATDTQVEARLHRDYFERPLTADSGADTRRLSGRWDARDSEWLPVSVWLPIPPRRSVSVRNVAILLCCCLLLAGIVSAHSVGAPVADSTATDGEGGLSLPGTAESNLSALLAHHEGILAGKSPDLFLIHDGTRGGIGTQRRWTWSRQRLSSEGDHTWHYEIFGELEPPTIGSTPARVRLVTDLGGWDCSTRSLNSPDASLSVDPCSSLSDGAPSAAVGEVTGEYLSRYLNETSPRVATKATESTKRYEIVSSDPPAELSPQVRNYSARAVVTPAGVIEEFEVSYRLPSDRRHDRRSLSLRIENHTSDGITG
jgi:hypothetical protein